MSVAVSSTEQIQIFFIVIVKKNQEAIHSEKQQTKQYKIKMECNTVSCSAKPTVIAGSRAGTVI